MTAWTLGFGHKASEIDRHGCKQLFVALYVEWKAASEVGAIRTVTASPMLLTATRIPSTLRGVAITR